MYDTIHFWVYSSDINYNPYLLKEILSNVQEKMNIKRGYSIVGNLSNFIVNINQSGIRIMGSLSKFYFGNNIETLSLEQSKEAIQMLSNKLKLSLFKAKVTRIDIGTVLITKQTPASYFKYFGAKPRYEQTLKTNNSLSYDTIKRTLTFYDKTIEAKKKKMPIPDKYKNKNLLRYELRFLQRLTVQLNEKEITGETLCKQAFYSKLISLWKEEYKSIQKVNEANEVDFSKVSSPKEVEDLIFNSLLIEKGFKYVDNIIKELKSAKPFSDAKYYSRATSRLTERMEAKPNQKASIMNELNRIISEVH